MVVSRFYCKLFCISLLLANFLVMELCAQEKNQANKSDDSWVVEIEPGIKRYGKLSKYSEVGQANSFAVSPDGETIAFAAGGDVVLWDIDAAKIRDRIKVGRANLLVYSDDGLRLFAATYGGSEEVVVVYNVITGEKAGAFQVDTESDEEAFMHEFNTVETDEDGNTKVVSKKVSSFNAQGIAVSQDGDRIAVYDNNSIVLFDVQTGAQSTVIKSDKYIRKVEFIDDGKKLVDSNGNIYLSEDGKTAGKLPRRVFPDWLQSLQANPKNSNQLVASAWNKGLVLYDLEKEERTELETDANAVHFLTTTFSGNGKLLAASTYPVTQMMGKKSKTKIYVWDTESGKIKNRFEPMSGQIGFVRFSATCDKLYTKGHNQYGLTEWDLSERESKSGERGHTSPVFQLKFCPDEESILTASHQSGAIFYDLEGGEPGKRIATENATFLENDEAGRYYVSAANYNSLSIYDRKQDRTKAVNVKSFQRPSVVAQLSRLITKKNQNQRWENFAINYVCVDEDNEHVLVACRGQWHLRYEKFDLSSGKSVERNKLKFEDYWDVPDSVSGQQAYSQLQWQPGTFAISRNGEYLAAINDNKEVFLIDAKSGDLLHELGKVAGNHHSRLYFIGNGDRLIVLANGKLSIWDTATGEKQGDELKLGSQNGSMQFAFNGDESRMAYMSNEDAGPTVRVIDFETMGEVFSRKAHEHHNGIALSNDGTKIALAKHNCQFDVWDLDVLAE